MRRISKKRRRLLKEADEARNAFRIEHPRCMICGVQACDIHEIARGSLRHKAYCDRHTWLHLCRKCHDAVGNYANWPIARQLSVKMRSDPEYYDLEHFNRLRGRAPNAIEQCEVDNYGKGANGNKVL